jgi:PAS domain-containing protein
MNGRDEPQGRPRLRCDLPGAHDLAAAAPGEQTDGQQRCLAEAEAERARLRDLFAQAPGLVAVVRGPEHVFDAVNPAYVRAVGRRDAAELLGRPVPEALPELVEQGYVELLDRVFATGEPFVGDELPVLLDRQGDGTREERFFNFV